MKYIYVCMFSVIISWLMFYFDSFDEHVSCV